MAKNIKKVKTSDLELKDRLVAINRVTKVTKGGRTFSFSAIVVVGNEDGIVGWGLGKASEVTAAIAKGVDAAKLALFDALALDVAFFSFWDGCCFVLFFFFFASTDASLIGDSS